MAIAGIDPGVTGAVTVGDHRGEAIAIHDTPSYTKPVKNRKGIVNRGCFDLRAMYELLASVPDLELVVLEEVNPFGLAGVAAFSLGSGFLAWQMAAAALNVPVLLVTPQKWKKEIGIPKGSDKDVSRKKALQMFPQAEHRLKRKKDHNRAESTLLYEIGRRHLGHRPIP